MNGTGPTRQPAWPRVRLGAWAVVFPLLALVLATGTVQGQLRKTQTVVVTKERGSADEKSPGKPDTRHEEITIQAIEPAEQDDLGSRKEVAWLGVATEEASEALGSQLGLEAGTGLVVTYVEPGSPAAKAGLQKNDVLVEFEEQALVHPAQLRKLVQVRKEGDQVKIVFYRAGKSQTVSVTLGKTAARLGWFEDGTGLKGEWLELQRHLRNLPLESTLRHQMKTLKDSLGNLNIDQRKLQQEIQRSMEEARRAYREALRHSTNAGAALRKSLEELAHSHILVDNDASVTVRSSGNTLKSLVKTDDSGTLVLVANPKLRLTAHDKSGKLLFDGEIDTEAQRAKVPRDLWARVEPLLEQMNGDHQPKAEADE